MKITRRVPKKVSAYDYSGSYLTIKNSLNTEHLSNEDTAYCPSYIEVQLLSVRDISLMRSDSWVPMVFMIERFHCDPTSQHFRMLLKYIAIDTSGITWI